MRFVEVAHDGQPNATVPETAVPHMLENGWTPVQDVEAVEAAYDPSQHSVEEVEAHLEYADVAERDRVIGAERAGKRRPEIVGETSPAE